MGVAESGKHQKRLPQTQGCLVAFNTRPHLYPTFLSGRICGSFGRLGVEELLPRDGWGGVLPLGPGLTSLP